MWLLVMKFLKIDSITSYSGIYSYCSNSVNFLFSGSNTVVSSTNYCCCFNFNVKVVGFEMTYL